ncbi:hypothetical protein E4U33_005116 [Claviceps sp. LM78 group G4]|nr:hypothetical protein E4U33_005116 [Claviceps sp. LM78 group G4]
MDSQYDSMYCRSNLNQMDSRVYQMESSVKIGGCARMLISCPVTVSRLKVDEGLSTNCCEDRDILLPSRAVVFFLLATVKIDDHKLEDLPVNHH